MFAFPTFVGPQCKSRCSDVLFEVHESRQELVRAGRSATKKWRPLHGLQARTGRRFEPGRTATDRHAAFSPSVNIKTPDPVISFMLPRPFLRSCFEQPVKLLFHLAWQWTARHQKPEVDVDGECVFDYSSVGSSSLNNAKRSSLVKSLKPSLSAPMISSAKVCFNACRSIIFSSIVPFEINL